jgi:hypothetical protein
MFDPNKVPDGTDVLKYYKELWKHKEFRLDPGEGIDNNKLMLYILCVYDRNSPYRKKYPIDILRRKIEACRDCGFETKETGNFPSPIEDFLKGNNKVVNRKVVEYCRMHRNAKYSYIVMIETSYYNMMLEVMGGAVSKAKDAKMIQEDLEDTMLEMLNQDNNATVKDELLRYIEDERLGLRPEDMAQKARDGERMI